VQPLGTVWLFLLLDSLPWSFILLGVCAGRYFRKEPVTHMRLDRRTKFLLCWVLLPNIFFTFTSNIIPTYPLVSLPALALLVAGGLAPSMIEDGKLRGWVSPAAALLPVLTVVILILVALKPDLIAHTGFFATRAFQKTVGANHELVYVGARTYSMEFYNEGKVRRYGSVEKALADSGRGDDVFLALDKNLTSHLSVELTRRMKVVASPPSYLLLEFPPDPAATKHTAAR
jgi:hypothetical protein